MMIGTMSALEGDGSSLGGIVQPNWYYFFRQQAAGQDVFDSPISFPIPATGVVSAHESGSDSLSSSGDVLIIGELVASEDGSDVFISFGDSVYEGYLSVVEVGSDSSEISGAVIVAGSLVAVEIGSDAAEAIGDLIVSGLLVAAEVGGDSLTATGQLPIDGAMAYIEASSDSFAAVGAGSKPIVVSGGRRRRDLDWPDWPVYGPEQARITKRKRDELLLLMS